MKTQKQLPNKFTFICDENSKEQLEKLGVDYKGWGIESIPCEVKGFYFEIYNYEIVGGGFDGYEKQYDLSHAPLIYLSDYLDQEQPELSGTTIASDSFKISTSDNQEPLYYSANGGYRLPNYPRTILEIKTDGNRIPIEQKWQEKTRGGYEYHIYEEFEGKIYGRVKTDVGNWLPIHWYDKGNYSSIEKHNWDLLPINHELTTLEKELEELRVKEKEILEKIEELKK